MNGSSAPAARDRSMAIVGMTALALTVLMAGRVSAADLDVAAFGARPDDGSDTTPAINKALEQCRTNGATRLVFPKGRYDFWPEGAAERYYFISNNDEGLKRIAFPLRGFKDLEIDGQGSAFVFHGYLNPFILDGATNVTLRNFSVDFGRTFHSEAVILGPHADGLEVEIPEAFPYRVHNGLLVFTDGGAKPERLTTTTSGETTYPFGSLLEFDARKREPAFMARDYWTAEGLAVEPLGGRKLRLLMKGLTGTPGNIMVFGALHRKVPGITVTDSATVAVEDVTLYHCGGMGVIAQRSRDLALRRVKVTPAPGSGRIVSVTADATHFVNCAGRIEMAHCVFENQKDDPSNIHGIYARVARRDDERTIVVQLVHPQQHGFDFIKPGMTLELVHGPGMVTFGEAEVREVGRLNKEFTRVVFAKPLPAELKAGDAVAESGGYPELHVHHCRMSGNRARGILLNCRGKTVIEDNYFHTPGAALLFEGDARFWFEQGGVRDCVIRNNTFDNCNYGVWGKAAIEVAAGIDPAERAVSRYNRNIRIEGNLFRVFDPRLLKAYCVDGLVFRDNRIERTTDYPAQNAEAKPFDLEQCDRVQVEPPREIVR